MHAIEEIIYYIIEEFIQEAEHCCIKSINILKNFSFHTSQKQKSNELLERIRTPLPHPQSMLL